MNPNEKITWTLLEYEEKEKNNDWFWALGVIVVAGATASAIFGNYFFALFIVVAGLLLGFFAVRKPDMVTYELNDKGLQIKNRLFPYEGIKSFWVQKEERPTLFIKSSRLIVPIISMPIESISVDRIQNILLANNVLEEEMKEHISDKIMESLGF
jgi:hypothetical protein